MAFNSRLIFHRRLNDGINPAFCSMSYISVHDAMCEIRKLGEGALMTKMNIKDAYRNIPVHPADRHFLDIQWQGATYIDGALLFGLHSAPKIFYAAADLLHCIIINQSHILVIRYLTTVAGVLEPSSAH